MKTFDFARARELVQGLEFNTLFVEVLGWNRAAAKRVEMTAEGAAFNRRQVAELAGVVVVEVAPAQGPIPDAKRRAALHKQIAALHHENLLIFVDEQRTQSLWYWVKRDGAKTYPRQHLYVRGQPGDLLLSKLGAIVFDISELDENGNVPVAEVASRLKQALDVQPVTKKFYLEFQQQHVAFLELIGGITDERQRRWYASVLLNRLMFIYFLQRKGFIDGGNLDYLQDKLEESRAAGTNLYYRRFLRLLFFEGFAKPEAERSAEACARLGKIKYLNGGLFLMHQIEEEHPEIDLPDHAFANLLALFARYSWNLNDTPGGQDDEINPDVLGYIFEKYINQKAFGAYYTRPEITEYLCERTVHQLILDAVNGPCDVPGVAPAHHFDSLAELLINLDVGLCRQLLHQVLPELSLLDPACGSGAFLVAAMKTLISVYAAVIGRIDFLGDRNLKTWLKDVHREHKNVSYFIKKSIIVDNLFGVDIMEEATEIAKLRLFLALVAAVDDAEDLEPLPNIDFNILAGNSLIGLMHVDDEAFNKRHAQGELFRPSYQELLKEKNRLIDTYRHASTYAADLTALRDGIQHKKDTARAALDAILLDEFTSLGIKFEQATWGEKEKEEGKPVKRPLTLLDIRELRPFHWGYEFDEIINQRGGFSAILANPPWESFKPNAKEFFEDHSDLVSKNKMRLEDFEKEKVTLLRQPGVRSAWLEYLSRFPHVSLFFRSAPDYENQISVVNGKKAGTDLNLYKLFTERCYRLLRHTGRCGMITAGGLYPDLGSKQLRELLFGHAQVDSLFGLSNERFIFEGVDHRQKFCIVSFEKGGTTAQFRAAFRIDPRVAIDPEQLDAFLHATSDHIDVPVELVRRLSPDSLSIMEFKNYAEVRTAEKMAMHPQLSQRLPHAWQFILCNEFHIRNDKRLFLTAPGKNRLALFTGKMFNQYCLTAQHSGYWIDEHVGRASLLGDDSDTGQKLDYQGYRWVHRRIARNSDSRTMISTIAPKCVFTEVNSTTIKVRATSITGPEMLFLCGVANSFTLDWYLRLKVSSTLNMFHLYQLPVPRLTALDPRFAPIVSRVARLVCTAAEYDDLADEVGIVGHQNGATDEEERACLRAELDGMVAHLYGLTEDEFEHILSSFPAVAEAVRGAALEQYRRFAAPQADADIGPLLAQGEGPRVEFKSSARWDLVKNEKNVELEKVIVKTVCGFLNAEGGTLLIGVDDAGAVVGLENDFLTVKGKGRDGYELFLRRLLLDAVGKDCTLQLGITFHQAEGKDLCRVVVAPSPRPVFLTEGADEHLYVRSGHATRRLTSKETVNYVKSRWT